MKILRVLNETAGVCTPGKGELGDRESLKTHSYIYASTYLHLKQSKHLL